MAPRSHLRIVTFNIHLGKNLPGLLNVLRHHPRLADADILSLQEVLRDDRCNQARWIAEQLKLNYVYLPDKRKGKKYRGLAILSRHPLGEGERIEIPGTARPGDIPRVALAVTVHVGAVPIRVYNVHIQSLRRPRVKGEQLSAVLERALADGVERRVVLGDFNTHTRWSRRRLHELLRRSGFMTPFAGSGWTHKVFFLKRKLDWIYLHNLDVVEGGVEEEITVSDHRPVWVVVSLVR